jgi:ligand-binding sensor domain-containing protein
LLWRKGEKLRTFGENEGLDSELARDVAVDRLDFVWLATGSGVGVLQQGGLWNFERYRDVLGELRVRALLSDQQGTMWVGTDRGTYYWRESSQSGAGEWGRFSRQNGLCGDLVADLALDAMGRVWHLTEGGFCVASPKK